jgi:hypothetical protein
MSLDPARVASFVTSEGQVTWTMTTNGYKFYTLNLVTWLRDTARVPWKLLVICCDAESLGFFKRERIPCLGYKAETQRGQTGISDFGSDSFAKWNLKKLELMRWFCSPEATALGIREQLFLDGDIVVRQDPWPVLKEVAGSIVCQCDCFGDEDHADCGSICSGVVLLRTGEFPADLLKVDRDLWIQCERQDQPYLRARLEAAGLKARTVTRSLFGNGTWQKSGKWRLADSPWILLHYNYRAGDNKKSAMRIDGHWKIPY